MIKIRHESWDDMSVDLPPDHVSSVVDPLLVHVGRRLATADLQAATVLLEYPDRDSPWECVSVTYSVPDEEAIMAPLVPHGEADIYSRCDVVGIPTEALPKARKRHRFRLVESVGDGFGMREVCEALGKTFVTVDPDGEEQFGRTWDATRLVLPRLIALHGPALSRVVRATVGIRSIYVRDHLEAARRKMAHTKAWTELIHQMEKLAKNGGLSHDDMISAVNVAVAKLVMES